MAPQLQRQVLAAYREQRTLDIYLQLKESSLLLWNVFCLCIFEVPLRIILSVFSEINNARPAAGAIVAPERAKMVAFRSR